MCSESKSRKPTASYAVLDIPPVLRAPLEGENCGKVHINDRRCSTPSAACVVRILGHGSRMHLRLEVLPPYVAENSSCPSFGGLYIHAAILAQPGMPPFGAVSSICTSTIFLLRETTYRLSVSSPDHQLRTRRRAGNCRNVWIRRQCASPRRNRGAAVFALDRCVALLALVPSSPAI